MGYPKYDLQEIISNLLKEIDSGEGMLKGLPHNSVNLRKIVDQARSEKIFKLKDRIPGKCYTLETYMVGSKSYVTIVYEEVFEKSCMYSVKRNTLAVKKNSSMKSAAQFHYNALGHLGKKADI